MPRNRNNDRKESTSRRRMASQNLLEKITLILNNFERKDFKNLIDMIKKLKQERPFLYTSLNKNNNTILMESVNNLEWEITNYLINVFNFPTIKENSLGEICSQQFKRQVMDIMKKHPNKKQNVPKLLKLIQETEKKQYKEKISKQYDKIGKLQEEKVEYYQKLQECNLKLEESKIEIKEAEDMYINEIENNLEKEKEYEKKIKEAKDNQLNTQILLTTLKNKLNVWDDSNIVDVMKKLFDGSPKNTLIMKNLFNSISQQTTLLTQIPRLSTKLEAGTVQKSLTMIAYLTAKYPDDCMPLNFKNIQNTKELFRMYIGKEFKDSYVKFDNPHQFKKDLQDCLKNDNIRFIFFPHTMEWIGGGGHAGFYFYDKLKNELERFEPHGSIVDVDQLNTDNIVKELILNENNPLSLKRIITEISTNYKINKEFKYIGPEQVCPVIKGFQAIESKESNILSRFDPGGYCFYWSMWYIEQRLKYKNHPKLSNSKNLINYLLKQLNSRKGNNNFLNFIRSYAIFVALIQDYFMSKVIKMNSIEGINEMRKLLKKVMGSNYDENKQLISYDLDKKEEIQDGLPSFDETMADGLPSFDEAMADDLQSYPKMYFNSNTHKEDYELYFEE